MTPSLRPYQEEAVQKVRRAFAGGSKAVCLQAPTGSGKTVTFAYIARESAARGNRIVILVHRRELLLQASRMLQSLEVAHGLIAPGFPRVAMQTQVASVQTLVRRAEDMAAPALLIVDEAHHATASTYRKIRAAWSGAKILGVTATPCRTDGVGLSEVFDALIVGPTMKSLVDDGFLVPLDVYAPPLKADLSGIHKVAGDFDRHDLEVAMDRPTITGDAVDHYQRLGGGRRAIAFCVTLNHAAHTAEAFNAAGIRAATIDGKMETYERDSVLRRFASGEVPILVSCQIVEEGFDAPEASVAILLRPTDSLRVFLQQVGRIMRPAPGKARGVVLDHVGNVERHGLPDAVREWSLEGRKRRKGDRAPPMVRCLACFSCFPPGPEFCPVCGAALPKKKKEPLAQVDGELKKVEGIVGIQQTMRQRAWEEAQCKSLEDFVALGVKRGYAKPRGWAWFRWSARKRKTLA